MKNRKIMFITILLLTIGFASVSTSLIINGNISFNTNEDDFDVYFSSAVIDGSDYSNEIISEDKQSITYETKNLSFIGDTSVLEYEVTNASKNYDAEVKVTCTGVSEEVTLTHTPETQVISATDIGDGKVEIKLNKTVVDEKEIAFTCTLNVNAVERNELGSNDVASSETYIIEGNYVDESGNAIANANLVIFSETPHYVTTDEKGYLFYNGLERGSHEIYHVEDTLENIKAMTKDEIISNAKTSAEFTTETDSYINFTENNQIENLNIKTSSLYCNEFVGKSIEFEYTGNEQKFNTVCDGMYKVELWGAQGGGYSKGGPGSYTSGLIDLDKNLNIYVYVGNTPALSEDSYNGGGKTNNTHYPSYDGGGSTDIRLVNGEWSNFDSLKSRIMVAAAGGGVGYIGNTEIASGAGGGLIGYDGASQPTGYNHPTGATQISGGIADLSLNYYGDNGGFGYGGNGDLSYGGGAGGSGYYGGGGGGNANHVSSGAGGSSFISGHNGCNAISNESTKSNIIHAGQANHYSGYVFTDTIMIDGLGYNWTTEKGEYTGMPTQDGTGTMTGNTGNGYARITFISLD